MRKQIIKSILILFVFIFCINKSFAGEDSIWLCGTWIKIGMPQETILSQIEKDYKITKSDSYKTIRSNLIEIFQIYSKEEDKNKIGSICFEDQKVFSVTKVWGQFRPHQGYEFANNLFNLISNLEKEGKEIRYLKTTSAKDPKFSWQNITFWFGTRKIDVHMAEVEQYKQLDIYEILEK